MFISQVIAIVAKFQPAALHLLKSFEKLAAFAPELAKIKAQELGNALSNLLEDLDHERDVLVNAIIGQVRVMGKLSLPSIAPHVVVLSRFFDIHGRDIADAPYNSETMRIDNLLIEYNAKPEVMAAAVALNMKMLFDQLTTVNATFASNFLKRTKDDSLVLKVDTRTIRGQVDLTLVEFFETFEHCSREFDELDYTTPANELNILINYYKSQLKARITRRNAGKDVSVEAPIVTPE